MKIDSTVTCTSIISLNCNDLSSKQAQALNDYINMPTLNI